MPDIDTVKKGLVMKRILILSNSLGGLYNFRMELIEELISGGLEVYISTPKGNKIDLLQKIGAKYIETPIDRRGMNPVTDLKLLLNYWKTIKEIKPNIVLTYTIKPNIYGSIACRLTRKPYLNNITGLGSAFMSPGLLTRFLIIMYKIAFKESRMVFFQNNDNLDYMQGKGALSGPYRLVPGSGVNLERFKYYPYPANSDTIVFNFIGRIMRDKGIDDYLTAARAIKAKYPTAIFNIIGSVESSQKYYEQIIAEHENEGYVRYLGYQKEIESFLIDSHCIIHPSRGGEGMSNVLLETAATGRTLIASNIPGCREIIDNDINGYTFIVGDVNDLLEKIERFICLPHKWKAEMGRKSREKVEKEFDRRIVTDNYLEVIDEILQTDKLSLTVATKILQEGQEE